MGRYRWINGMTIVRQEAGYNQAGQLVQVSEIIRPFASTVGIRYVSVKVNRVGVQTEQFSGQRCGLEPLVFEQLYQTYVNGGTRSELSPAQKAAQTRKLRQASLAPAPQVTPLSSDDIAIRRRNAALKAAATRKARAAQ